MQFEQRATASKEFKSSFVIRSLNTDNLGIPLTILGSRFHSSVPMYPIESCFPYVVVLNLGTENSSFRSLYLIAVLLKRSAMCFGQMLLSVLYIRTAISYNRLFMQGAQISHIQQVILDDLSANSSKCAFLYAL